MKVQEIVEALAGCLKGQFTGPLHQNHHGAYENCQFLGHPYPQPLDQTLRRQGRN